MRNVPRNTSPSLKRLPGKLHDGVTSFLSRSWLFKGRLAYSGTHVLHTPKPRTSTQSLLSGNALVTHASVEIQWTITYVIKYLTLAYCNEHGSMYKMIATLRIL